MKLEQLIKAASRFVSKDPDRRILNGVYLDAENQKIVATDGKRIIVIPAKVRGKSRCLAAHDIKEVPAVPERRNPYGSTSRSTPAVKRQPAIKKGNRIRGTYPNWMMVVSAVATKLGTLDVANSLVGIQTAIDEHRAWLKGVDAQARFSVPWISAPVAGGGTLSLDAKFVLSALRSLDESGAAEIAYESGKDEADPITLRSDTGAFAILMPARDVARRDPATGAPVICSPLVFRTQA
jgi:hypothetical protein